jgi:cytochrome P450
MTATIPDFDPFDPSFFDDPYPRYAELRHAAPIQQASIMGMDAWVFSKYDDVSACLRNHDVFSSQALAPDGDDVPKSILMSDPPLHTKLRRLVSKPFQPSALAAMEPWVRDVTNGLIDEMIEANRSGAADLVQHMSYPLPMIVIAQMLGVPPERRSDFRRWSEGATTGPMLGLMAGSASPDELLLGDGSEMNAFFEEIVRERQRNPGDDLISMLVTGDEPLTHTEVLMFAVLLLIAGNETTTNLISNAAMALFANPEQAELLASDLSLVPSAMEEALRYDPPVQLMFRQTKADTTVKGHAIPAGSFSLFVFGSANRDEDQYPDPDRFDVRRNPRDHLAFGAGIHLCLGAALSRLEGMVVWETLLERTPNLRPNGPGVRSQNPLLRGMRSLPVTFDAR